METKYIRFEIKKCINSSTDGTGNCYPDEVIKEAVKDLRIQGWSIESYLDYDHFGVDPHKKRMKLYSDNFLRDVDTFPS